MEMAEDTRGPECRAMRTWTRMKPASEEEGERPSVKARMRVKFVGEGGREGVRRR